MTEEATDGELLDLVASQLYDSGGDPVPLDMHSACAVGNYKCVQEWIDTRVNLDAKNKAGWTPLMYASYVGHDTIVNLLLDARVDPSCSTPTNLSPLMVAAGCGNESVCYFLIQAGAGVDCQDCNGYSALVHAVRQGHQTVVQLLLEAGADIELKDKENEYTALMFAAIEGDEIIVDVLLACGADVWATDKMDHNARYLAFNRHHVRTVTLLDNALYVHQLESESNTNALPNEGQDDDSEGAYENSSDLFSGAKEMEAYQQSVAVKKSIQFNLGRRTGPRWSLPHQYIADRRLSKSDSTVLKINQRPLRTVMSMPEQPLPPIEAMSSPEPGEGESGVEDFLAGLGLHKYIEVFDDHEIDFQTLLDFTDDDLKRIGITLMGPRRKITQAIAELREKRDTKENTDVSKCQERRNSWGDGKEAESTLTKTTRPPLVKQSSTNITEAYREARRNVTMLEEQLGREHQLRKSADTFLLDLQTSRREAVTRVSAMMDMQKDIMKHCKAVRGTHDKLSAELDQLRTLSDPRRLKRLYSELVTLKSKLGMELEALSRSIDSEAENVNSLSYVLKANS